MYENNKSAAQAIKDEIKKQFGVWDGTFLMEDTGVRYIEINSALVSAQNRQRFYVHNCGNVQQPEDRGILLKDILESGIVEKEKGYRLKHQAGNARDYFKKHHTNIAFQPINITKDGKSHTIKAQYFKNGIANFITNGEHIASAVAVPIRISEYSSDKARPLSASTLLAAAGSGGGNAVYYAECSDGKTYPVYEVRDGIITIKGKQYPIKLVDGFYIIRKLTVTECCRLQTLPDDYCRAVSASQAYKGLGNGWTAEVIIHILSNALKDIPRDEKVLVLSMYDGIATGRYCLDKMGFTNVEYHAYEIDKYAMKIAMSNYPDIIQHGDAFAVRNEDWKL